MPREHPDPAGTQRPFPAPGTPTPGTHRGIKAGTVLPWTECERELNGTSAPSHGCSTEQMEKVCKWGKTWKTSWYTSPREQQLLLLCFYSIISFFHIHTPCAWETPTSLERHQPLSPPAAWEAIGPGRLLNSWFLFLADTKHNRLYQGELNPLQVISFWDCLLLSSSSC